MQSSGHTWAGHRPGTLFLNQLGTGMLWRYIKGEQGFDAVCRWELARPCLRAPALCIHRSGYLLLTAVQGSLMIRPLHDPPHFWPAAFGTWASWARAR